MVASEKRLSPNSSIGDVEHSTFPGTVVPPSTVDEKKLMRKIDLRVVPVLCVLYLLAFLDRVNISNAALYGLKEELGITVGNKYNIALVIFFVPYILLEIPSNLILKKFKPHMWLSACMFMFGLMTITMGLIHNYSGLLATRFFLGVFESGMFPGCFYLLSCWYKRAEAQKRYSFFFGSTSLAGAFGGLLAAAIGKLDFNRGYRAWRWVFIIEGACTAAIGLCFYFLIPDFPEEAKFLTEEERAFLKAKLEADSGDSERHQKMTLSAVGRVFRDWKIFLGGFMYFGLIVPAYGYGYFSPTIVKSLGKFTPIQAQLRTVPPWACAFVMSMITAIGSDYFRKRYLFIMPLIFMAITGFAILFTVHNRPQLEYFALFFCTMGTYGAMPIIICWFACNLGSHARRSVGTGFQVGFGNIGGIIATFVFITKEAPLYPTGYKVCIGFLCLAAVSCTIYLLAVMRENRQRDQHKTKYEGISEEELQRMQLGDLHPQFRYML